MTGPESDYARCKEEVRATIEAIADRPAERYRVREEFYRRYGAGRISRYGYGGSELRFLEWEIKRGVLNPLADPRRPGSAWWRTVNTSFLIDSSLAAAVHRAGIRPDAEDLAVLAWLQYIERPDSGSWYRAHNTSIVHGYHLAREVAVTAETRPERDFMNVVLYRLLYAQAIVLGHTIFGELGRILADPMGPAVDLIVHIPAFYPRHYPLSHEDAQDILDRGHSFEGKLARLLDKDFVLPHLRRLYSEAANWNTAPFLPAWAHGDRPTYPSEGTRLGNQV